MPVFRKAAPIVKSYVKSAPVQRGIKKIRKKALKSAMSSVSDLMSGQNPKSRLKKDMVKVAKIASDTVLGDNQRTNFKKPVRKSRKRSAVYFGRGKSKKFKKISVFDL